MISERKKPFFFKMPPKRKIESKRRKKRIFVNKKQQNYIDETEDEQNYTDEEEDEQNCTDERIIKKIRLNENVCDEKPTTSITSSKNVSNKKKR